MIQSQFTVQTLEPETGKYITQKNVENILDAFLSKKVILAVNDSIENYKEVTEEEAELIRQTQKEQDPNLYPTEDEVKLQEVSFFDSIEKVIDSKRSYINTLSLTDSESLKYKLFYPKWEELIGQNAEVGFKFTYKDTLYKVKQKHTFSKEWNPESGTESLYEVINEIHAGTLEDPIPYNGNMTLEMNKYYIQNDVIYLCNRGTGQPVYQPLADLVGIYVEVVEQ